MFHFLLVTSVVLFLPQLNKNYPVRYIAYILLFLFLALRYDYGNDYMSYFNTFELIKAGLISISDTDPLFWLLNVIMPNFYILIAFISLFYISVIANFIEKNLKNNTKWIGILLLLINPYLFLIHLSSLRQTIAILIFVLSTKYLINKNLIKYVFTIFIASLFHSSAIILLLIYPFISPNKLKSKNVIVFIIALILVVTTPLLDYILNFAFNYFPEYRFYYLQGITNSIRSTILTSFILTFILLFSNMVKNKYRIYTKLSIFALSLSILTLKVSMMNRMVMYFEIFLIIILPVLFINGKNTLAKKFFIAIVIIIYILRYVSFFSNPLWENFNRYRSLFNNI
jgi:transmembrane protein EpsG